MLFFFLALKPLSPPCRLKLFKTIYFLFQVLEITYQSGETALLPCNISNNNPEDRVTLLLWYKEDSLGSKGSPIYRIDARTNQDLVMGTQQQQQQPRVPILDWVNEQFLGKNRVSFDTQLIPASLKIRNVTEADAGLYRCRVDFTNSQTRTERTNLRVVVRPVRGTRLGPASAQRRTPQTPAATTPRPRDPTANSRPHKPQNPGHKTLSTGHRTHSRCL